MIRKSLLFISLFLSIPMQGMQAEETSNSAAKKVEKFHVMRYFSHPLITALKWGASFGIAGGAIAICGEVLALPQSGSNVGSSVVPFMGGCAKLGVGLGLLAGMEQIRNKSVGRDDKEISMSERMAARTKIEERLKIKSKRDQSRPDDGNAWKCVPLVWNNGKPTPIAAH